MKHCYPFLLFLFSLGFHSCERDDLEATVPAYLEIDDISVKITDPVQGSASDKITDAWVFVNDQLLGAFELPTAVPILQTGNVNIKVRGGIFKNGLSNQRDIYPFYEFYILDTILSPEGVFKPKIEVEYKEDAIFDQAWSGEDFESGINFLNNPNSDTSIARVTNDSKVFEGVASGGLFLTPGMNFAEIHTPAFANIPRIGTPVYLEFNYRSTHDIAISIYTNNRDNQFSVVNFVPSADWNKAYVDFTSVFSSLFDANDFNIAIGVVKPVNENAEILLDNVKLINF